jgi:hypothetical protein
MAAPATRRSATSPASAAARSSEVRERRTEDGWMVASAGGPRLVGSTVPPCRVTRKLAPKIAWAAVAPMSTTSCGLTRAISPSSQGRQALTSARSGFWVDAPLAAGRATPLEVLHDVRDVHGRAIDAGLGQRLVQQASRGTDERLAGDVLAVAGLLPHQHQLRALAALAEHGLGRVAVEVTGATFARCLPQLVQRDFAARGGVAHGLWVRSHVIGRGAASMPELWMGWGQVRIGAGKFVDKALVGCCHGPVPFSASRAPRRCDPISHRR